MARFDNILETVGRTPVVRINRLAPAHVNLYVKVEAFNPLGSVKDRLALGVIEAAEKSGELKPGQTVIEATSGNTGIGLAMVCAAKGYPLVVTMAESFSVERRKLMRFLGAKVVLTPAALRATGMVDKADGARQGPRLVPHPPVRERGQPRHALAHHRAGDRRRLRGRAARLLGHRLRHRRHAEGRRAGAGQGAARTPRSSSASRPTRRCWPAASAQARNPDGSPAAGHPAWKPHPMQGWTPDFIPKLTGDAVDAAPHRPDAAHRRRRTRMRCSKDLAPKEGIFVGITAGATFAGALKVAAEAPKGANILCMLPDTGERYLSTPLFADVPADMTEEELAILKLDADVQAAGVDA